MLLEISLNLGLDASHKQGGFFETLPEKIFEFVLNKGANIVTLNIDFVLLFAEVHLIPKEQSCKRDALGAYGTSSVKIVLTQLREVIALYMGASII